MKKLRIEIDLDPVLDLDSGIEEYIAKVVEFNEEDGKWQYTSIIKKDTNIYDTFIAAHLATLV